LSLSSSDLEGTRADLIRFDRIQLRNETR